MSIQEAIYEHLDELGMPYQKIHHQAATTSEEAVAARGELGDSHGDAKALFVKNKEDFAIIVLSGDKRLDWKLARKILGNKLRMATAEELLEKTGLVKGSLPPFGNVVGYQAYIDEDLPRENKVQFNVGTLTDSIVMNGADLLEATEGIVGRFYQRED